MIKKLSILFISLITLNGCIETTAFLGPALTVGTSGNVYQAGISYASNNIIYHKNLELLWECCQIPDFEKKAYGQHINIIDKVFLFLKSLILNNLLSI